VTLQHFHRLLFLSYDQFNLSRSIENDRFIEKSRKFQIPDLLCFARQSRDCLRKRIHDRAPTSKFDDVLIRPLLRKRNRTCSLIGGRSHRQPNKVSFSNRDEPYDGGRFPCDEARKVGHRNVFLIIRRMIGCPVVRRRFANEPRHRRRFENAVLLFSNQRF